MRVLWITQSYRWTFGGIQVYTTNVLKELDRTVDLKILAEASDWLPRLSFSECVWTTGLGRPETEAEFTSNCELLTNTIGSWQPNLIHFGDAGLAVYNLCLDPNTIPTVATVHGNDLSNPWQRSGDGSCPSFQIASGLSICRRIITLSRYCERLCTGKNIPTPVSVIDSGIDKQTFRPLKINRQGMLAMYRIPADVPIILTAGRVISRKGHAVVLEALRRLSKPFHWVIVGESKGEAEVLLTTAHEYGLQDCITFIGGIAQQDLARLYNACDLFVFTPIEIATETGVDGEGFGLVLLEASATGLPVISSNISGCREAVVDGETGILVPAGDPESLAAAIIAVLGDEVLMARMSQAAIKHASRYPTWGTYVSELQQVYESVVQSP
jgi:glycosyltransferase involved in cell wall biosynthesis